MNLSTPRPEGRGLLEVHPEPRSSTPPSKAGLRAVERVKLWKVKNAERSISNIEKVVCLIGFLGLLVCVSIMLRAGPLG